MVLPWLALLLGVAVLLAFLRGRLPLELVALCLAIAAVLAGWLTPVQALAGFGNPATITVVAMFVLSAAIVRTGALEPVERWLGRFEGTGLSSQLLLLALVVGPLSAVISNTAVVAMFIPVVERWCRRLGVPPSRMLMPLSFLTVLAGVGTLLGTSTNLVASSLSQQLGYGSFGLFQFTPLALLTYLAGALLLALVAPLVLSAEPRQARGEEPAAELAVGYGIGDDLSELQVSASSPLIGRSIEDSLLQHSFDVRVLSLTRGGEATSIPLAERRLREGDVLVVKGRRERLPALCHAQGLERVPEGTLRLGSGGLASGSGICTLPACAAAAGSTDLGSTAAAAGGFDPRTAGLSIVEVLVPAGSPLIDQSLREIRFAQRFNAAVLAIRRGEELLRDRLGRVRLRLGDALLLQAPHGAVRALEGSRDLLLAGDGEVASDRRDRLPWAVGLALAVPVLTLWRSDALALWALLAVAGMVVTRVLTPQEVYAAVRWDVVVLIGALLPLAQVMANTGADRWLVQELVGLVGPWPPYALLIGLYLITALVTEIVSNQAAVTLMLPLGLALCQGLGVSAWAAMGVMTFAASHSFLTPIGYQTNTMVYALGNYSFADFFRLGLPLTLTLSLLTPALALALPL